MRSFPLVMDTCGDIDNNFSRRRASYYKSQYWFVSWAGSRIDDKNRFYEILQQKLPPGTEIFGCQEDNNKGVYHAVVKLSQRPRWREPKKEFTLCADDGEVDVS